MLLYMYLCNVYLMSYTLNSMQTFFKDCFIYYSNILYCQFLFHDITFLHLSNNTIFAPVIHKLKYKF